MTNAAYSLRLTVFGPRFPLALREQGTIILHRMWKWILNSPIPILKVVPNYTSHQKGVRLWRGLGKHGITAGVPHCLGHAGSAERGAVISSSRKFSRLGELPHCWLGQLLDQYPVTGYCKTIFKCGAHMALGLGFFHGFGGMYYSAGV